MNRLRVIANIALVTYILANVSSCTCVQDDNILVNEIRPPAAPLITVDPYFSIWSMTDEVTADVTRHFSEQEHPLLSAVRVDGKTYRVLGEGQPKLETVLPTITREEWSAKCVFDRKPSGNWTSPAYDDSGWEEAPGAFGSLGGGPKVRTRWAGQDRDIWVRRSFDLKEDLSGSSVILEYSHDDVFELYINDLEVVNTGNTWKNGIRETLPEEITATLRPGKVTVAAHCHNTVGGAYVDFGLFKRVDEDIFNDAAIQKSVNVLPMRTIYTMECGGIELEMTFTAPMFLNDLDLMSRPVNYLNWKVRAFDGLEHDVQVYFETTPAIAVDSQPVPVTLESGRTQATEYIKTGSVEQRTIDPKDKNPRIQWGYYYIAVPDGGGNLGIADYYAAKSRFLDDGTLADGPERLESANFTDDQVAIAYVHDFGRVGNKPKDNMIMLAYDDIYSIQYFHENLRPYWARRGRSSIGAELDAAAGDYARLSRRCQAFDRKLMEDATAAGGKKYAELCALAYRQAIAAHKLVQTPEGELLWLAKENFSGALIGTVDVSYPASPLFLYYNPKLCEGMLNGVFRYSESGLWTKPYAAHDLGHYPCANGQHYGYDMPVEECGNMLILCAAISKAAGNAEYARKHWQTLTGWADYLLDNGQDPANQLCTDDFAGHLSHNSNLSIKAIEGLGAYGMMAGMLGKKDIAEHYMSKARDMAESWKKMSFAGDHYRLAFDRGDSWSQKYNLVWNDILGLGLFDSDIADTEIAYYRTKQNRYGLPLDNRRTYTKSDWTVWTASLSRDRDTFEEFIAPLWDFYNETSDRVPMSDWIYTDVPKMSAFRARSVVGGYWIKLLKDKCLHKR